MCFSGEMSAFFAAFSLVLVWVNRRAGHPLRIQLCILYFGAMELLQAVQYQYLAVPEDDFAMCKNKTNQFLTALGAIHIVFQPYFLNMGASANSRIRDIAARHRDDLVLKLCLLGAAMTSARFLLAAFWPDNPEMANAPSQMCPNYEWIRDGYDAHLNWTTPNLPGHSCTFRPPTPTGHLAWAIPMYQATYFVPGVSLHCFLMFGPRLVGEKSWSGAVFTILTGPVLVMCLTKSLNEQPAVWCFFSMFYCSVLTLKAFVEEAVWKGSGVKEELIHKGTIGEEPMMVYNLVEKATKGHSTGFNKANGFNATNGYCEEKKVD